MTRGAARRPPISRQRIAFGLFYSFMKRSTVMLLAVAGAVALSSCVGIDTQLTIAQNGSVEAQLAYSVPNAADELGKLGSNAAQMPVPIGRDDLALAATRAGGSLASWSRKDGDESFTVTARLDFPDPAALARFLDPQGKLASFSGSDGRSTLSVTLSEGKAPADPDLASFLRLAFGDRDIAIKVILPRNPSAQSGFAVQGRTLSYSAKAVDLYSSKAPVTLSVSW